MQLNFGHGKGLIPGLIELLAVTGKDDGTDCPRDVVESLETPASTATADVQARLWRVLCRHARRAASHAHRHGEPRGAARGAHREFPTMVMDVADKPRDTFILHRGDYLQPTTRSRPARPAALPPLPDGAPANRLGLARWVVMGPTRSRRAWP